jgi:hypothetical protein
MKNERGPHGKFIHLSWHGSNKINVERVKELCHKLGLKELDQIILRIDLIKSKDSNQYFKYHVAILKELGNTRRFLDVVLKQNAKLQKLEQFSVIKHKSWRVLEEFIRSGNNVSTSGETRLEVWNQTSNLVKNSSEKKKGMENVLERKELVNVDTNNVDKTQTEPKSDNVRNKNNNNVNSIDKPNKMHVINDVNNSVDTVDKPNKMHAINNVNNNIVDTVDRLNKIHVTNDVNNIVDTVDKPNNMHVTNDVNTVVDTVDRLDKLHVINDVNTVVDTVDKPDEMHVNNIVDKDDNTLKTNFISQTELPSLSFLFLEIKNLKTEIIYLKTEFEKLKQDFLKTKTFLEVQKKTNFINIFVNTLFFVLV